MRSLIREYLKIERAILYLIVAEFFLQLINSSFLAILPLYMRSENYTDGEVAHFTKYRFIGVLVLALFVGLYIKRRKVKNLFYASAISVPLFSLLILHSVHTHNLWLNYVAQILWGASFTFIQIPVLPYILRNCTIENHTSAISLSYATWSFSSIAGSIIIAVFNSYNPILFNERTMLHAMSVLGFISIFFISKIKIKEIIPENSLTHLHFFDFDWWIIIKGLIPTLIIAIGAGFTIPFISLFFANVHGLSTAQFASINLIASTFVAVGAMIVPNIKKNIGYKIAIPTTQSFAIIALILMATTQYYKDINISVYIAIGCFLLRQPLMNMAGPMTSEVVMGYVGKRNQEMVSALTSAIWSGSWFFSSIIFGNLRNAGIAYVNIFLITAGLYIIGVIWYYLLILDYERIIKNKILNE